MSFGTRWAIRAAVFGLFLHLLLASAIICILLLVARNISIVKSVAIVIPFFIPALEFLSAVSLLRTKRRDYSYMNKCSSWFCSIKYLSPCIIMEEGILISWEFHFAIIILVAFSYVSAMILVTNCLTLKCSVIQSRTNELLSRPSRSRLLSSLCRRHNFSEVLDSNRSSPIYHQNHATASSPTSENTGRNAHTHTETRISRMHLVRAVHDPCNHFENVFKEQLESYSDSDDDTLFLPSYDEVLIWNAVREAQSIQSSNDSPPSYNDVIIDKSLEQKTQ